MFADSDHVFVDSNNVSKNLQSPEHPSHESHDRNIKADLQQAVFVSNSSVSVSTPDSGDDVIS
jgi:hypothetical protein